MQKGFTLGVVVILVLVAGLVGGGVWAYQNNWQNIRQINSYESCIKAGNPVTASYPGTCRTSDGRSFVQPLSDEEKKKLVPLNTDLKQSKDKIKICPDEWYKDQIVCVYEKSSSECPERGKEFFFINGKREEIENYDTDWIKSNCSVKEPKILS